MIVKKLNYNEKNTKINKNFEKSNRSMQNCLLVQKGLCAILCAPAILYARENLTAKYFFSNTIKKILITLYICLSKKIKY